MRWPPFFSSGNASFDPTYHTNVLYLSLWDGSAAITTPATVYNNIFRDIGTGTPAIYFTPGEISPYRQTLYAYNNLIYGANAVNIGIEADPAGTTGTSGTLYAFNNTVVLPAPRADFIHCVDRGGNPEVNNVVAQNNHIIGTDVTVVFGHYATATLDHNLVQTASVAAGQGYVPANLYEPPFPAGGTVDRGISESSVFTTDIRGVIRPQGAAWDIGTYELPDQGPGAGPDPPTGLRIVK